jgi:tRNA-intron endonuclease
VVRPALDEGRLVLSPVEALYLLRRRVLSMPGKDGAVTPEAYLEAALPSDPELAGKCAVYADLREHGYIPRTGYKFGHHFRVYIGDRKHSELLVHALPPGIRLPMSAIARSVRLAHSVKKKMLFGCVQEKGIRYIEFGRIKL